MSEKTIIIFCEPINYAVCQKCNTMFFVLYDVDLGKAKFILCPKCCSDLIQEIINAGYEADIYYIKS
jgi:hypothetical protein